MKELSLGYLIKDDTILLAMKKRGFGAGKWNGVGGKLEPGESVEAALIRECQEEIAVTPTDFEQVADITFHEFHDGSPVIHHVRAFIIHQWDGEPSESEEMRPQWFPIASLPYDAMWSDDSYWLPNVLAGKKIIAQFSLDKHDELISQEVNQVTSF